MTPLTEGRHAGEFLVSEAQGSRSRETVTLLTGQNLKAGAVLGQITVGGKYVEYDPGNVDGSETAVAVLIDNVDATAADILVAIIARDAEVNAAELEWFTGATGPQIATGQTELAAVGIIAR